MRGAPLNGGRKIGLWDGGFYFQEHQCFCKHWANWEVVLRMARFCAPDYSPTFTYKMQESCIPQLPIK